jgi:hypothetical protein
MEPEDRCFHGGQAGQGVGEELRFGRLARVATPVVDGPLASDREAVSRADLGGASLLRSHPDARSVTRSARLSDDGSTLTGGGTEIAPA